MSPQAGRQALAHPSSASMRRLVPAAFVAQALASVVIWLLINDESLEGDAWSNTDFREWVALSLLSTTLAGIASGAATRRDVIVAVTAGCTLAVIAGCALFVGYAVLNSSRGFLPQCTLIGKPADAPRQLSSQTRNRTIISVGGDWLSSPHDQHRHHSRSGAL